VCTNNVLHLLTWYFGIWNLWLRPALKKRPPWIHDTSSLDSAVPVTLLRRRETARLQSPLSSERGRIRTQWWHHQRMTAPLNSTLNNIEFQLLTHQIIEISTKADVLVRSARETAFLQDCRTILTKQTPFALVCMGSKLEKRQDCLFQVTTPRVARNPPSIEQYIQERKY
jgi:hypothetical protein